MTLEIERVMWSKETQEEEEAIEAELIAAKEAEKKSLPLYIQRRLLRKRERSKRNPYHHLQLQFVWKLSYKKSERTNRSASKD
ncbi:hypothetical protein GCM10020331_040540 [Ectobacillus funiculus]